MKLRQSVTEIPASVVLRLLQTAAQAGAEPSDILARARVPYTVQELSNGMASVGRQHVVAIYRECIVTIGGHSSRLDSKPQMHPDEFRLMCYCVISCRTLRDVIDRQAMFFRTRGDRISVMELREDGPMAIVTIDTLRRRKSFSAFLSDLAGMSIFTRFYAWLLGIGAHDFRVQLMHSSSYANEAVADFFVGDLLFDGAVNSISFSKVLLGMPIVRTAEELDRLLLDFPFEFMSALPFEMPLGDRLRSIYTISLARGVPIPSLSELSKLIGQSISTIRRRLADDDISIRSLKDAARRDAAIHMLRDSRRTVDDVALTTGFRDISAFRAAFRRWTGTSPALYCDALRAGANQEDPGP